MKSIYVKLLLFSFLVIGCTKDKKQNTELTKPSSSVKYAKGFDIITSDNYKKLIITSPYQNSKKTFEYFITTKKNKDAPLINELVVPVREIVVTSTTHIPMIELLEEEHTIVGFPFSNYISSKKTRKRIDDGLITEIGKGTSLNTEIILNLDPDLVVGYSITNLDKSLTVIQKSGVNVIYNGDWLEETPLGRAEWIKFFGALYNKEKEADSIFKLIESNYLEAKAIAKKSNNKPTILSGAIMRNDIWNLPAGESFVAKFLSDANVNYLWKDSKGKGSQQLSFESVFDKAQHADYWIAPGYFSTKEQMLENNSHYKSFTAFQQGNIYTTSTKTGVTGGVIYYELAPTRPDLVLKDIIKITNPSLLSNYELTFFEKMK